MDSVNTDVIVAKENQSAFLMQYYTKIIKREKFSCAKRYTQISYIIMTFQPKALLNKEHAKIFKYS